VSLCENVMRENGSDCGNNRFGYGKIPEIPWQTFKNQTKRDKKKERKKKEKKRTRRRRRRRRKRTVKKKIMVNKKRQRNIIYSYFENNIST
jgi:hypothetical protein